MKECSPLEAHVGYWLRFVSNHVSQAFRRKVEARGVSVSEWVAMREMLAAGTTAPAALARRMGMTRGAVSKILASLESKRLIRRTADEADRRSHAVALTAAGERLVPQLAALADTNDAEFFDGLPAGDRTALLRILRELVKAHGLETVPVD